jgi:hypothetical protein
MRFIQMLLSLVAGLMLTVTSADAAIYLYNVTLEGLQEVPPNPSPATGTATVTFDDVSGAMSVSGSFSGLLANYTASHVHGYVSPGTNAAVIIPLSLLTGGGSSGTFGGNGVIPSPRIPDVLAGLTYINVHSAFYPGGEIRGQISTLASVPEPVSIAVWAIVVGGFVTLRRVLCTVQM